MSKRDMVAVAHRAGVRRLASKKRRGPEGKPAAATPAKVRKAVAEDQGRVKLAEAHERRAEEQKQADSMWPQLAEAASLAA